MKDTLSFILERSKEFWENISASQRVLVGVLAAVLIAIFIALIIWLNKVEYTALFSNLSAEDANKVIKKLEAQQVSYRLEEGVKGSIIYVPEDRVHTLRIGIAGDNILTGQGVGFELFDEVKMGETDFSQKLKYRRALEGELTRTITQFPSVEAARVHLVVPNRSLFIEDKQAPSASVLLQLADGKKLEQHEVKAIVNLLSMAVADLDKSHISIADTGGNVLFQPELEGAVNGLTQTQLDHKRLVQTQLARRIEELLMPIVGAGRVKATVNADMDFSQKTIRRELYDPEKTVIRSESTSQESTEGSGNIAGGQSDPNFRGDGYTGSSSTQNSNRETRTTNYEINKEEQNVVTSVGDISRMTVAVIVDGTYQKDADGKTTFVPRAKEELDRIRQLVINAVGVDSVRGDTLEVSNLPFEGIDLNQDDSLSSLVAEYALRFGKPLLNAILVFLFLVLVIRPVVLAFIRPKVEGSMMIEGLEGLPMADERLALVEADDEAVAATIMLEKIEDIKAHSLQLSEQNMDQALGIIKSWLKDCPEVTGEDAPVPQAA